MKTMEYNEYLTANNLERLPASQIPKLLNCHPRDLSVYLDHFCLLGRDDVPLELHFEIYTSTHRDSFVENLMNDAQIYGFQVEKVEKGLDWHNPGRTVKYILRPGKGSDESHSKMLSFSV